MATGPTWDASQYLQFADERTRAARELLTRVPLASPRRVIDLGCGPGNSTALLLERWPQAQILGLDNSPQMIEAARQALPQLDWALADLADTRAWSHGGRGDAPVDLLFANAVLQWLPDHASLLPRLLDQLAPGGVLAVQMPLSHGEPSHRLMRELARDLSRERPGPWGERLNKVTSVAAIPAPEVYYDWLAPHARHIDLWTTRYEQVMPSAAAIVEWVSGSGLRPYLQALTNEAERAEFLAAYEKAIDRAYPPRIDGRRLYSFPRAFMVVVKRA
ncbi:trans-aconitate 2-methyltransferase [Leptothrix ochracea]|uniref:trans-aconitate 2-methyltransferase n=1 Tax=Leptothrix ochracea TaxID=735331 RepID=UPI0034E1FB18